MSARGWRWPLTVLVLLAVAGLTVPLAAALDRAAAPPRPVQAPRAAPGLAGTTLDGGHVDLADSRGDVVLVNVWASWCAPCREEMPLLADASRRFGGRGLRVVGVDTMDRVPEARAFLASLGDVPFPHLVDPEGRVALDWGAVGVPETFVVDRGGTVVARAFGPVTDAWLDEHVVPLLAAP